MKARKVENDAGGLRRVQAVRSTRCGKLAYPSRKFAKQTAAVRSRETGEVLEAYKCPHGCHAWHVGHPIGLHSRSVA